MWVRKLPFANARLDIKKCSLYEVLTGEILHRFFKLAVEMGVANPGIAPVAAGVFMLVALFFVHRSFYGMRIASKA